MMSIKKRKRNARLFQAGRRRKARPKGMCLMALRFARMWGVMETLGALPPMQTADGLGKKGAGRYEALVFAWARDFSKSKGTDVAEFFEEKAKRIVTD